MSSDRQLVNSGDKPPPYHRDELNPDGTRKMTKRIRESIGHQITGEMTKSRMGDWVGTIIAFVTLILPLLAVIRYSPSQLRDVTPSESPVNLSRLKGSESAFDP